MSHLLSNSRVMNEIQPALKRSKPHRRAGGFTLVELLVTIAIVGILMGMVLGIAGLASSKSSISTAQSELERISVGLDEYRALYGEYPRIKDGPADLTEMSTTVSNRIFDPDEKIRIASVSFIDPWGRPYRYERATNYIYKLWSTGPDVNNPDTWIFSGKQQ